MPDNFQPVAMEKGDQTRVAFTRASFVQLKFDGYRPVENKKTAAKVVNANEGAKQ